MPSFPAETFTMGFNQHKPVLEQRALPKRRRSWVARKEKGWGSPLLLRRDIVLDVLYANSFLLIGLLCRLGDLSTGAVLLLHRLDDTDGHGLPHVSHSKATWEKEMGAEKRQTEESVRGQRSLLHNCYNKQALK